MGGKARGSRADAGTMICPNLERTISAASFNHRWFSQNIGPRSKIETGRVKVEVQCASALLSKERHTAIPEK